MRMRRGGFRAAVVLLVVAGAIGLVSGPAAAATGGDVSLLGSPAVSLLVSLL
ncbi:hypothetical protein [Actinoplanes cyaneus]|nr:hypothetical protein [Actinoplanes cyaneus]MCW2137297.1 hypothetical protein [Actinoplanes cyaneus]